MKIPLNFGGGGGSGSDECTATASDVLESKTAIYNGSDDEPEYGTMKDYSGTTNAASAITQNGSDSRIELTVPNTGKYDTASKIYYAYSSLASTIGLTAAKIATGNTILGIAGTYTGLGSATAAQVLSGKTFSTASLSNASGTMTDKSGTTTSATSSVSGSNYRLLVPANGYYNTSAYLTNSYSNTASTIGLTAAKIKYGESILGITGTWSGYVGVTTDIYNAGTVNLCGSINVSSSSTASTDLVVTQNSSNITFSDTYGAGSSNGIYFGTTLKTGRFTKITMEYNVTVASSSTKSHGQLQIAYNTGGASAYTESNSYRLGFQTSLDVTSTGSKTASLDITNIYENMYVGVGVYTASKMTFQITRIYVS